MLLIAADMMNKILEGNGSDAWPIAVNIVAKPLPSGYEAGRCLAL
jgi:hypothetical protein